MVNSSPHLLPREAYIWNTSGKFWPTCRPFRPGLPRRCQTWKRRAVPPKEFQPEKINHILLGGTVRVGAVVQADTCNYERFCSWQHFDCISHLCSICHCLNFSVFLRISLIFLKMGQPVFRLFSVSTNKHHYNFKIYLFHRLIQFICQNLNSFGHLPLLFGKIISVQK